GCIELVLEGHESREVRAVNEGQGLRWLRPVVVCLAQADTERPSPCQPDRMERAQENGFGGLVPGSFGVDLHGEWMPCPESIRGSHVCGRSQHVPVCSK